MVRPQFVNNEIYHIYNRGVEKRDIFMTDVDYFRFIHNLFEFNDIAPALSTYYHSYEDEDKNHNSFEIGSRKIRDSRKIRKEREPRKLLVEILAWCLMPNHYHLLLKQVEDNGISRFIQKLGIGYTMYFNQKYERNGVLFQGKSKAVLIKNEAHFLYLPFYFHANPLDLIEPSWREGKLNDYQKTIKFLESYRYSSHLDYINKINFSSISQRRFILELFEGSENYKQQFQDWLKEMGEEKLENLTPIILET